MHTLLEKSLTSLRLLLWLCALPLGLLAGPLFLIVAIVAGIVFKKNLLGQGGFLIGLFYPAVFVGLKIQETAKQFNDPDRSDPYGPRARQRQQSELAAYRKKITRNMDSESRRQFNLSVELKQCIEQRGEDAVSETARLMAAGAKPNIRTTSSPRGTAMHALVHVLIIGIFPKDHPNYESADLVSAMLKAMFNAMTPADIAESCLLTMNPRVFIFAQKTGLDLATHNLDDIALHFDSMSKSPEFIVELLAAGIVPKSSRNGLNALHLVQAAFVEGFPRMERKDVSLYGYPPDSEARLLAFNALLPLMPAGSINEREHKNGFTPLHFAVASRLPGLIDRCLDAGADPLIENKFGQNPSAYGKVLEPIRSEWTTDDLIRAMRRLDALTEAALIARTSEQGKSSPPKRL